MATYPLAALTRVAFASLPLEGVRRAARDRPAIEDALWWDLLVASAIEREHIVSLGRRSATERLAHLFCELQLRLALVDLADANGYDMPVTQADIADMLGLTPVHVNRSLQDLRRSGLIALRDRRLILRDLAALRELALFDPDYLHPAGLVARWPGEGGL